MNREKVSTPSAHSVTNITSDCIGCARIGNAIAINRDTLAWSSLACDSDVAADYDPAVDIDNTSDSEYNYLQGVSSPK